MDRWIPMSLPWLKQLVLHDREFALIAPDGAIRVKYACAQPHHSGPRCDRCGHSMLLRDGTVNAEFDGQKPGLAYIECRTCLTRNTRPTRTQVFG